MKETLKAIQMKVTPDTTKKDKQVFPVKTGLRPGKKPCGNCATGLGDLFCYSTGTCPEDLF